MSVRLLLDEMFHPRIASELTARGHDCLAVAAEPDLRESDDADLLAYALEQRRTLVTNNVVDFERLRRQRDHTGQAVPPLIYTSDAAFRVTGGSSDASSPPSTTPAAAMPSPPPAVSCGSARRRERALRRFSTFRPACAGLPMTSLGGDGAARFSRLSGEQPKA